MSTPHVLNKMVDGKLCEPIERMVADVPENSVGAVIDKISQRKGELVTMTPIGSRMRLEFLVPTRGLFGYRNEFLTDTRGEGIMASVLDSYAPVTGDRPSDVVFNVGGNVSYASSKAIRLDNVPLTQTFLGSTSVDVTSGTDVPVNVTWHFNGTYSNQNIATIVAADTLPIH